MDAAHVGVGLCATCHFRQTVAGARSVAPDVRSNGARHDLLQLLLAADMPSVLVEVGYLSNPVERSHIIDKTYQRAVAKGIAAALQSFLSAKD